MVAFQGAVAQGIIWGIMVLGVYITFRLLELSDLTVDGSFALGGCVCAVLIMEKGMNPIAALLIAALAGMVAGGVTGALHTVFEIPAILAGILTQISLWSINLRIMGQKSNLGFEKKTGTVFSMLTEIFGLTQAQSAIAVGFLVAVLLVVFLYWFFGTELGSALRATGNNEDMIRALGVNTKQMKLIAFMLSNGLVALSGALICQSQKYGDIGMGTGAIVIGLASIVIGEVIFRWVRSFSLKLAAVIVGAIAYFLIRAAVLAIKVPLPIINVKINSNDMKLISAVIVALALCVPVITEKWRNAKSYSEDGGNE